MSVKVPEAAVLSVILAAVAAVLVPGIGGLKAAEHDRNTQQDVAAVAKTLDTLHSNAQQRSLNVSDVSLETASASRVRVFPAQGAAVLIDVHSDTQLNKTSPLIHRPDESWCFALTNHAGRVKTYHHDSKDGSGQGPCPEKR